MSENIPSEALHAPEPGRSGFRNAVLRVLRLLGWAGVVPGMDQNLAKNVIITNFAAYGHVLMTFPYYWVFKALGATWLSSLVFPLTFFFMAVPQINRLGFTTASRLLLLAAINVNVYLYTASIGMETSIQNVFFFTLVSPLMLFRVSEWRSILVSVAQPIGFWVLLICKGSWFIPRTYFDAWAFHFMSPAISMTTAIMLFACSFLISFLQQTSEARLERAKEAAESSDRAKSRFLATMSHEIRTPMNGIFGMLQILMGTRLYQENKEELDLMKSSCDLLLVIINDILDFSKIEAGKVILEERLFDLRESVGICKTLMEKSAADKGLSLTLEIADDCPSGVIGDETRYRQVIMNLANNAVKFTKSGGVRFRLERLGGNERGDEILFSIRDTGIGMSLETLGLIFLPFSQADSSTTREYGGTGLGLAISKRLALAMGGDLTVKSVLGQGSDFRFSARFKTAGGGEAAAMPAAAMPAVPNPSRQPYEGKKALLVEDNPINQKVASRMVAKLGFAVTLCENGAEAVQAAGAEYFDMIFMDCQMPVMDGFEATRILRARETPGRRSVIIALTANAGAEDRERCMACGMDAFISKPLLVGELKAILAVHLRA